MPRRRRRLLAISAGLLAALVAFELALQVGALFLWSTGSREGATDDASRVVLCVGDSFTYGLGASGPAGAYPAQLQDLLEARDPGEFAVVNGGTPGQASDAVLRRLPSQLARHRPTHVVILAGYNDQWKKPDPVPADALDESEPGFPIRWRTGELLSRAWGALLGEGVHGRTAPVGTWLGPGVRLVLAADRGAELNGEAGTWEVDENRLVVRRGVDELAFDWERVGEALLLRSPVLPEGELRLLPEGGSDAVTDPSGRRLLEEALADPEVVDAAWVERTCAHLRDHPEESPLWWRLTAAAGRGVQRARILGTVDHALTRIGENDPWRAGLLRMRAGLIDADDPVGAFAAILEAALIDGSDFSVVAWLGEQRQRLDEAAVARAVASLDPDPAQRARIDAMLERARRPAEGTEGVLVEHLTRIAALCRDAGAEPIFVTYPEPTPVVDTAIRRAAERARVTLCDVVPVFRAVRRAAPNANLFAPDRHCNDAGYGIVAEVVARSVLE